MTLPQISAELHAYSTGQRGAVCGITFHLPSRSRFIPYSWLLYAELNEAHTELSLYYTHAVVTISGTHLIRVLECTEGFELTDVREVAPPSSTTSKIPAVTQIEIVEKV